MNLSTRLDYLGPANTKFVPPTPPTRPLRSPTPSETHLNDVPRSGRVVSVCSQASNLLPGTIGPKPNDPYGTALLFAPIRLKFTFEALRREGADFTDLQSALAG